MKSGVSATLHDSRDLDIWVNSVFGGLRQEAELPASLPGRRCPPRTATAGSRRRQRGVGCTGESRRLVRPGRTRYMLSEDAEEGVIVHSQAGDDALGIVPDDEYKTVFSFPTVGNSRCHGFWLTFYVDAVRSDSGQGPRGKTTKYARSLRAFKARASKRDPPKVFVSTPPAGLFSHRDIVWQSDVQWPYEKSASNWLHAVIPAERLLDF